MKIKLLYAAIAFAIAAIVFVSIRFESSASVEAVALRPLQALLIEREQMLQDLGKEKTGAESMGLLGPYLTKIRRDGVAAHLDEKQKLDALDKNIISTLALVDAYLPYAKTENFKLQARKYTEYGLAWHDRWSSVMELFMAGGVYSVAEPAFPNSFSTAVASEINAVK